MLLEADLERRPFPDSSDRYFACRSQEISTLVVKNCKQDVISCMRSVSSCCE